MVAQVSGLGARLLLTAFVVVAVTVVVFALMHLIPGDPVEVMLGEYAGVADREALRHQLGLDRPVLEQWWHFARGAMRLDLGISLVSGRPVVLTVLAHFQLTLVLALAALVVAIASGIPLGVLAAIHRGSAWDTASALFAVAGMSLPNFVLGPLLIMVFAVQLGWLPVAGADGPAALVLPAVTLGFSLAAVVARMTRAALLEVLSEPYILAARARGLGEWRVICRHALPNAALPIVTTLGLQLGALLGGAVITEVVFGWPGVGQLVVDSIQRRDYPLVQGCVLLISVTYVVVNTLIELLYRRLDPRIAGRT